MTKIDKTEDTDVAMLDLHAGRRAFLKTSGLMAAGAAALGLGATAKPARADDDDEINDAAILNFALNLEYLEAEFYLRAAFGRGLANSDTTGSGRSGAVSVPAGAAVSTYPSRLSREILGYAKEIANDEENHVQFLRKALNGAQVARPAINLNTSFTAAARAAGLITGSQTFNAFANDANFLLAAFIFEDVGVTAYKGAAPLISSPAILEAAAGLLAVEAYHAAAVRTLLATKRLYKQANAISGARDSLDGNTQLDQGIGSMDEMSIVPTDRDGLAFSRTPRKVLNIVYLDAKPGVELSAKPRPESFLPNGVNGFINGFNEV